MKKAWLSSGILILFFTVSSTLFAGNKPDNGTSSKLPENVNAIIQKSCYGCHNTDSRNEDAKEKLDFKKVDGLSVMKQISAFKHIGEAVDENEMPPKKFLEKRPEKKLTDEEKQILIAWAKKEAETLVKSK
jgi:uncharacterized membrane protein